MAIDILKTKQILKEVKNCCLIYQLYELITHSFSLPCTTWIFSHKEELGFVSERNYIGIIYVPKDQKLQWN
jgi:hypothetical protein